MSPGFVMILAQTATAYLDVYLNSYAAVRTIMQRSEGKLLTDMLTDGKDTIGWYFEQILTTTPAVHLSSKIMYQLGQWGTDAELWPLQPYSRQIFMSPTKSISPAIA